MRFSFKGFMVWYFVCLSLPRDSHMQPGSKCMLPSIREDNYYSEFSLPSPADYTVPLLRNQQAAGVTDTRKFAKKGESAHLHPDRTCQ